MSVEGGGREIAYRMFAAEYDDASLSHTESDEERAPNYVVTPTGARVNRLFVVGALTEVSQVNEEMVRARVVDPTGAFVVYAGQYQPDELAYLERAEPPCFVAVTGKARTFEPDDGDRVYTSIRPESIATVDADTRDRWIVNTAEQTIDRIATYAKAAGVDAYGEDLAERLLESGLEEGLARGIPLAQDHYGTTPAYLEGLRELAVDAVRVVADERDQVGSFDLRPEETRPDAPTFTDLAELGDLEVEADVSEGAEEPDPAVATATAEGGASSTPETSAESSDDDALEASADDELPEAEVGDAPSVESAEVGTEADADLETGSEPIGEDGDDLGDFDSTGEDDLGDFDSSDEDGLGTFDSSDEDDEGEGEDDIDDFDGGGMYEMDEEEREQIEEQFGAEFTTGSEVDDPGEAGIDVPEPDEVEPDEPLEGSEDESLEDVGTDEPEPTDDGDGEPEPDAVAQEESAADELDESEADEGEGDLEDAAGEAAEGGDLETAEDEGEAAEDVDLQSKAIEVMNDLDDGDGADREAVIETVVTETGAGAEDVEDAIQDALMGGQCYEPDDGTLKAI